MQHIIWRKNLSKKKISVTSRLWGQHASCYFQLMLAESLAASTQLNAVCHQGLSNLIWLQWVFFSFLWTDSIAEWNQTKSILSQDQTVSNLSWISTMWMNFLPPLHAAWKLLRDRIQLVLMYFTYTLVLQWILWQCFQIEVNFWVIQHLSLHHWARYWNSDIQIALSMNIARQHLVSSITDSITS